MRHCSYFVRIKGVESASERELTRKKYIASLENRTPEQIAEEESLFIEIKRLEQNERRFRKEREELLRTLGGIESGLPDIIEDEGLLSLSIDNTRKKQKKGMGMDDSPLSAVPPLSAPIVKRPQTAKNAAFGENPPLSPAEDEVTDEPPACRCSALYHPNRPTSYSPRHKGSTCSSPPSILQAPRAQSRNRAEDHRRTRRTRDILQPLGYADP